jgi:hypothetical protein
MDEQLGEGWRLLQPNEEAKFGDEFLSNATGAWHPITPGVYGWHAVAFIKVRRRAQVKPEAIEISAGFKVEVGYNPDDFVISQVGPPDSAGDVIIGNAKEARDLAGWLIRYADWNEDRANEQTNSRD